MYIWKEELLIGWEFWNFIGQSDDGYKIILEAYKDNVQLGRRFIGIELDPLFFEAASQRIEATTTRLFNDEEVIQEDGLGEQSDDLVTGISEEPTLFKAL